MLTVRPFKSSKRILLYEMGDWLCPGHNYLSDWDMGIRWLGFTKFFGTGLGRCQKIICMLVLVLLPIPELSRTGIAKYVEIPAIGAWVIGSFLPTCWSLVLLRILIEVSIEEWRREAGRRGIRKKIILPAVWMILYAWNLGFRVSKVF